MKSLFVEGESLLHRLSPRLKLVALALFSLATFLIHALPVLLVMALFSLGLFASLRIGWRESWLRLRALVLTIIVVCVFTLVMTGVQEGTEAFLRLSALILMAAAVTATTTTGDFIDEITALARPLERLGLVNATDIGLAIGLVIRFVPEIIGRYQAIRDAHHARGLRPGTLSILVPLIILTLRNADDVAAAIDARRIRGQNH